jgi:hypothetical protein
LKLSKLVLFTLPLLLLGLVAPLAHAQDISSFNWIGALRNGNDPFYGGSVVAYRTGTTATLAITFDNTGNTAVNVTRVMVLFDWGLNYTSKGVPLVVNVGVLRTFNITFTVPGTGTATNLVVHSYTITVSFTDIPNMGPRARSTPSTSNFAIFSNDQADAMTLMQRLGGPATSTYLFPVFRTAQASALAAQATSEANLGQSFYSSGDFTNAKVHLANASNLLGNATSVEQSKSSAFDLSAIVSGWGGLLLGIGATIIGVSALIYVAQRRRQTHSSTSATPAPR